MANSSNPRPVALVTGGRRGIGQGIVLALAGAGFDIAIADLEQDDDARATAAAANALGARIRFIACDVANLAQHDRVIDEAEEHLGALSCLVNNAGISVARRGDILEVTPESFDRLMQVNLRGPFFLTQRVAARFVARPASSHFRSIVNVSSANASAVSINRAEYCLSKSGVAMATKLFAVRLADTGVCVYEIRPGVIRTAMTSVARADYDQRIADGLSPIRRWGEAEDVGRVAATLATGAFGFTTGESINVDGGLHVQRL